MQNAFSLELYYYYFFFFFGEIFNLNLTFSGCHKRDSKARPTRIYTLGTSRGFASRLLRMKGLVTPWFWLIATGIRIFLTFFHANQPQVDKKLGNPLIDQQPIRVKTLCGFKRYTDLCGRGVNGVTTSPWECTSSQICAVNLFLECNKMFVLSLIFFCSLLFIYVQLAVVF